MSITLLLSPSLCRRKLTVRPPIASGLFSDHAENPSDLIERPARLARWTNSLKPDDDGRPRRKPDALGTPMSHDILSDLLRSVRLRGALFYYVSGSRNWAAEAPAAREIAGAVMPDSEHVMEYHVVTRGSCWGAIVGEAPVRLVAGDIVLFPHGDPHVMSSAPGMRARADVPSYFQNKAEQLPFTLHVDGVEGPRPSASDDSDEARLVCGFLGCDVRPFNPLIATLPRLLHLRAADADGWTVEFMRRAV